MIRSKDSVIKAILATLLTVGSLIIGLSFALAGVSGADEDIFICTPTSLGSITACAYSPTLYFDGSAWGLAANDVDAIDLP